MTSNVKDDTAAGSWQGNTGEHEPMRQLQESPATSLFVGATILRSLRQVAHQRALGGGHGVHGPGYNILSFGCSLGEELLELRAFFPMADIHGCDSNAQVLQVAQDSVGHLAEVFRSSPGAIEARGPYDLIVSRSSLCMSPPPPDIAKTWPFAEFEDTFSHLVAQLKPGGIILAFNTSYFVQQAAVMKDLITLRPDAIALNSYVQRFDRTGSVAFYFLSSTVAQFYPYLCGPAAPNFTDTDLIDCIFQKPLASGGDVPAGGVLPLSIAPDLTGAREIFSWSRSSTDAAPPLSPGRKRLDYRLDARFLQMPNGQQAIHGTIYKTRIASDEMFAAGVYHVGMPNLLT